MACRWAKWDVDEDAYMCPVTGDRCIWLSPSEKGCHDKYHEGPLAYEEDLKEDSEKLASLIGFAIVRSIDKVNEIIKFIINADNPDEVEEKLSGDDELITIIRNFIDNSSYSVKDVEGLETVKDLLKILCENYHIVIKED